MSTDYKTLELERDGAWLTIWLNRPESRNALSDVMVAELVAAMQALRPDRTIRGVTLRGRGHFFCAGGDIKGFSSLLDGSAGADAIVRSSLDGAALFQQLNSLPQVLLVLIEGAAMAGGLGMTCCADVVITRDDAKFALTETTLGISPAQIAPYVASRLGLPVARRLMLTAARFNGVEAQRLGLADFVAASDDDLIALERSIRTQTLRCAPEALAVTKDILLQSQHLTIAEMQVFAASRFAQCMLSPEGREGIAAFVEKRRPRWAEDARQ